MQRQLIGDGWRMAKYIVAQWYVIACPNGVHRKRPIRLRELIHTTLGQALRATDRGMVP